MLMFYIHDIHDNISNIHIYVDDTTVWCKLLDF